MDELTVLDPGPPRVVLRRAGLEDLRAVVELLAADQLGAVREDPAGDLAPYRAAFGAIDGDPAQVLAVAAIGPEILGTMQLSFIRGLARRGALRAQIEAVRVHAAHRGRGIGKAMVCWAIDEARRRDCALIQLTSDKARVNALGSTPDADSSRRTRD